MTDEHPPKSKSSATGGFARTPTEVNAKITELRAHGDYPDGPSGRDLRYKHQGWLDALWWVQTLGATEEP